MRAIQSAAFVPEAEQAGKKASNFRVSSSTVQAIILLVCQMDRAYTRGSGLEYANTALIGANTHKRLAAESAGAERVSRVGWVGILIGGKLIHRTLPPPLRAGHLGAARRSRRSPGKDGTAIRGAGLNCATEAIAETP